MQLSDLGLSFNPFKHKIVYDYTDYISYPFILTESQITLKFLLETSFPTPVRNYYVILGERGSGKTSTLLFLQDLVKKQNNPSFLTKYDASIKGMGSILGLRRKLLPERATLYSETNENVKKTIEDYLRNKYYYWFIDVPDKTSRKDLDLLTTGLEILLGFRNINVIIAMNKSHYNKSFSYSEVMGKFTPVTLKPFNLEETKNLILKRLEMAGNTDIFEDDVITKVWEISRGNPRNILSACDILLSKLLQVGKRKIDMDLASKVLVEDYVVKILNERIENPNLRACLLKLLNIIKEMGGEVIGEKELIRHNSLGWCAMTIRKYLRILEKLGLISIQKSSHDNWTNVIRVVS